MQTETAERMPLVENDLLGRIKAYLLDSGLNPGDTIESEVVLAERFGVSRYQMRKILGSMVQSGILKRTPRRGTVLCDFDTGSLSSQMLFQFRLAKFNIAEFREARTLIERAIIPLTVRRITAVQLERIEQANRQMRLHCDKPKKADEFDKQFHILLFEACGNDVLRSFSEVLTLLFQNAEYRRQYWTREMVLELSSEHDEIVAAIRQGDAAKTVDVINRHLRVHELNI